MALLVSMVVLGGTATAGVEWCEEDPVFMVNGSLIDVTTAFPANARWSITDPVAFELLVPVNATAAVVSLPGAVPLTAKITRSLPADGLFRFGVPVVVKVTVKSTQSFDTKTRVSGTYLRLNSYTYGTSNTTTKVGFTLIGL